MLVGTRKSLIIGDEYDEKYVSLQVVDPHCPTIRDRGVDWLDRVGLRRFMLFLRKTDIQCILITPTDPVKLVVVKSTYPILEKVYFKFPMSFIQDLISNSVSRKIHDWLTEGF